MLAIVSNGVVGLSSCAVLASAHRLPIKGVEVRSLGDILDCMDAEGVEKLKYAVSLDPNGTPIVRVGNPDTLFHFNIAHRRVVGAGMLRIEGDDPLTVLYDGNSETFRTEERQVTVAGYYQDKWQAAPAAGLIVVQGVLEHLFQASKDQVRLQRGPVKLASDAEDDGSTPTDRIEAALEPGQVSAAARLSDLLPHIFSMGAIDHLGPLFGRISQAVQTATGKGRKETPLGEAISGYLGHHRALHDHQPHTVEGLATLFAQRDIIVTEEQIEAAHETPERRKDDCRKDPIPPPEVTMEERGIPESLWPLFRNSMAQTPRFRSMEYGFIGPAFDSSRIYYRVDNAVDFHQFVTGAESLASCTTRLLDINETADPPEVIRTGIFRRRRNPVAGKLSLVRARAVGDYEGSVAGEFSLEINDVRLRDRKRAGQLAKGILAIVDDDATGRCWIDHGWQATIVGLSILISSSKIFPNDAQALEWDFFLNGRSPKYLLHGPGILSIDHDAVRKAAPIGLRASLNFPKFLVALGLDHDNEPRAFTASQWVIAAESATTVHMNLSPDRPLEEALLVTAVRSYVPFARRYAAMELMASMPPQWVSNYDLDQIPLIPKRRDH